MADPVKMPMIDHHHVSTTTDLLGVWKMTIWFGVPQTYDDDDDDMMRKTLF